mgnify:CR=1 FL=1
MQSPIALVLGVLSVSPSFAVTNALYAQLKKEIPEGNYIGKRHDGKPCQLVVTEVSDATYRNLYKITAVFPDTNRSQTFEFRKIDEVNLPVYWDSSNDKDYFGYVGPKNDPRKEKDGTRTWLNVGRGKKSASKETYYEGYDKELLFSIEERAKQNGFKGPVWRVRVGAMNWGKEGGGGLTCHIEPLHK